MQSFDLKDGTTIDLELSIGKCKMIKSRCEIDLLSCSEEDIFELLTLRPMTLTDVIWYCAVNPSITQDDFDSGLVGDSFKKGIDAFFAELLFFTQTISTVRATTIQKVMEKQTQVAKIQIEALDKTLSDPRAMAAIEKAVNQAKEQGLKELELLSTKLRESSGFQVTKT